MKLKNKVIISFYIFILLMLILSIKIFAVTGTITEGTVNVREKTDTNSKKVTYVFKNDKVEVLEKDGSWYKVKAKGKTGYIYEKYVKVDQSALSVQTSEQEANAEVTKDVETKLTLSNDVQVRLVPNLSSCIITTASKNTKFQVLKQMDTWTYVSVNGFTGWIRSNQIIEENNEKSESNHQTESQVASETVEKSNTSTATSTQETTSKSTTTKTTSKKTKKAYIKYDTVNLREKASATSKILAKLKLNDEVTVLEKVNNVWAKVSIEGKTGYVSQDLLSDKKQTTTKKETTSTTTSRGGESSTRKNEVETKDVVTETPKDTTNKIKTTETKETTNKEEKKTDTKTSSKKVTGENIVAYAKQYLGYKYVYGAASPSKGFDCSGLVYYVYKHFGYTLSRSSSGQASNGVKVEKKDLQPGDILIYKNNALTKIGHVGIYIGNNKMIHASEPGVGVVITDIDAKSHKYPQRYVMARRIINE